MKLVTTAANSATTLTMSSLEMVSYINSTRKPGEAELRHDHFVVKVQKVLAEAAPKFLGVDIFTNGTGGKVERKIYNLPKREAMLMAMSYSYELQAQVFDAWETAEATLSKAKAVSLIPNFDNPIEAAEAWISEKRISIALTNEIAVAKPKIAFHDAVVADETTYSLRETAKILNQPPLSFNRWLRDEKYIMINNVAYEYYKNMGVLVSQYTGFIKEDGSVAPATTRITSKGVAYFQKQLTSQGM